MPRRPLDLTAIREDVQRYLGDGQKVQKIMRCGHADWVFHSVDPSTTDCWASQLGQQTRREKID
jgi:hypothetical protein